MFRSDPSRRAFLQSLAAGAVVAGGAASLGASVGSDPPFRISLAEWSLHNALFGGEINNLDFPVVAKEEFGIEAVEYVNAFFKDKAQDQAYLTELKGRCEDHGVRSVLIMCDGEGALGDPIEAQREQTVENHKKWVDAAKFLGCHAIRVNARSSGGFEEQQKLAADGLAKLGEFADQHGINVLVENHGGLSSNGAWLAGVMKQVSRPNVGTLPDFGNFIIDSNKGEEYDRYQGIEELMPYAKAVSAKSQEFNADGEEVRTDYFRMMQIVMAAGYHGYVGIEWGGSKPDEYEGIRLTKRLLERVRESLV